MKRKSVNPWVMYVLLLLGVVILAWLIISRAGIYDKFATENTLIGNHGLSSLEIFKNSVLHNIADSVGILLLQIIAILVVTRILSGIFVRIGQPTVIAEILAGILLGPSLLGYFYPNVFDYLFAPSSVGNLHILSVVGLILFMFVIGMELSFDSMKGKVSKTLVIGHASIFLPFLMGLLFAFISFKDLAAGRTDFLPYALFVGTAMSITAFPVLARIVHEKGMSKTEVGQISIASAAFNDVTAWCILAVVIAISKTGSFVHSLYTIGFAIAYILFMMFVIKPFMKRIGSLYQNMEVLNKSVVAFIFLMLIISSFITQLIGIHALFGAFLVGVIMPEIPEFRKLIVEKVEDIALTLLFPLFFVYTGLRTDLTLLSDPTITDYVILIIAFAFSGKFLGSSVVAKFLGNNWRDSLSIGALMNTQGLMEIVVINIGYDMGIISPLVFVLMVVKALVTTFMTSPLLYIINKIFPDRDKEAEYQEQKALGIFKVLIAIGNPQNGGSLLNLASSLLDGVKNSLRVTALHITPGADTNPLYGEEFAKESFLPINGEAETLDIQLCTDYQVADNIEQGVVRTINQNNYDFLLVGAGFSMSGINFTKEKYKLKPLHWIDDFVNKMTRSKEIFYPGSLIKDKTKYFIEHSRCSVGVFINRGYTGISNALVFIHEDSDEFLIRYAKRLLKNNDKIRVAFVDENKHIHSNADFKKSFREFETLFPEGGRIIRIPRNANTMNKFDLMLISYQSWCRLIAENNPFLENIPSTLIINKKVSRFHTGYREKKVMDVVEENFEIN